MIDLESLPRLTRHQAVEFLNGRGIPVTIHSFDKACASGGGPQPTAKWGRQFLYEPRELILWSERRLVTLDVTPTTNPTTQSKSVNGLGRE